MFLMFYFSSRITDKFVGEMSGLGLIFLIYWFLSACSTVLLPARVVQALNLNMEELGAQQHFPDGFVLDHGKDL